VEVLRALKLLGVQLWLDDFGTRHSSIEHLQLFPVDGLKLPGAFVRPLPHDKRCIAITRTLIALAHDLGMQAIGEEVEERAQLDFLLEQRCELVQGFLFSRPMTAERLQATLAAARFSSDGA
jgi:EAL domain-containing protein (putative c-di-GMP-specific phosphodiesterase class I)